MPEEEDTLPDKHPETGLSLRTIITAAIILVVLVIIWAFFSGRL